MPRQQAREQRAARHDGALPRDRRGARAAHRRPEDGHHADHAGPREQPRQAEAGRKGGLSRGSAASGAESKAESKRTSKTESKRASKAESKRTSEEEEEGEEELGVWINPSDCENRGGGGAEFVPPTLEEVESYFAANCLRGSARKFYDYYEANGWTRQGFPIAKWEPVARSWSDREKGYDAERKARGGQTSQEVERAAVWQPAKTDDELIAELERQVAEAS